MDFKCKKIKAQNQKTQKTWLSEDEYRITWRKEALGVRVPARYMACVRVIVPGNFEKGYTEMWDFVNPKKHLYRSMKVAVVDCQKHHKLWEKATTCSGVREFYALFGGREPHEIPKWAYNLLNDRIRRSLMKIIPRKIMLQDEVLSSEPKIPLKDCLIKTRKPRSDKGKPRKPYKVRNGK